MTLQQTRKLEIAIFLAVLVILTIIWAINGYEDTWYYATAAIIAIPISWYSFRKKNNDR